MPRPSANRRLFGRACLALLLAAVCLLTNSTAYAQEPSATLPVEESVPPPAGPDSTLWIDDNGVPRPVLGVSFEEFTKAWRAYQGRQPSSSLPLYTIQKVDLVGEQQNGFAELTVSLSIDLSTEQPVEVPLGFGRSILLEMPTGLSEDDLFGYSDEAETHRAFLHGGGARELQLKLLAPITATGQRNELSVTAPRANLSQILLQLKGRATEATATSGVLQTSNDSPEGTSLKLRGAVGRVRIAWRNPEQAPVTFEPVLTATGELLTQLDGGSARTRARITVQSYGGEFERFQVRLPRGAQLVQPPAGEAPPVKLRSVPGEDDRIVLVQLPEKTSGPVSVDITTEQPIGLGGAVRRDGQDTNPMIDLGGFEVIGAVRQFGDMALVVDPDSKLRWGDLVGSRKISVEELPDTLRVPDVTAALRYFRQGFQAPVEVLRPQTRIEATTSYTLKINQDEAILEVATQYQISGPPVLDFNFALGDWTDTTADQVEPSGLIDLAQVYQSEDGMLEIPMLKPQSIPLTLKFRARKVLPTDGKEFSFSLPRADLSVLNLIGRSDLTVTVDPSLILEVQPETRMSLHPQPVPAEKLPVDDPSGVQTQYFQSDYALITDDPLRFVGRLTRRPAQRHARVATTVRVTPENTVTEQIMRYELLNKPTETLRLTAPPDLLAQSELQFRVLPDDAEAPVLASSPPLTWRRGSDGRSLLVDLPRPWLGPLTLQAKLPDQAGWDDQDREWSLPVRLLSPEGCDSLAMELSIETPAGLSLNLPTESSPWKRVDPPAIVGGAFRLSSTRPSTSVVLTQREVVVGAESDLVINKAWRQAWVRGGQVQQRIAWNVTASQAQAEIELPPAVERDLIEVRVAGKQVAMRTLGERVIGVPLPLGQESKELTLELRYLQPLNAKGVSALRLRSPRLLGESAMAVSYWELIVSRERLLLNKPSGFEAAWDIAWQQGRFRRRQALETQQLESWVGAAPLGLSPATGEHAYLYSSVQTPPGSWTPNSIDRNLTALAASALFAVIGLAIGYAPGVWRAFGVGLAATALALAAVLYPGELALVSQAGMIGLTALFVGWLTMVLLRPPQPLQVEISDDSTAIRLSTSSVSAPANLDSERVSTDASTASLEARQPAQ